jgi:hypothetical protein
MCERSRDLLGVKPRIQRDEDGAKFEDGVGEGRELGCVAQGNAYSVALLDAEGAKGVC